MNITNTYLGHLKLCPKCSREAYDIARKCIDLHMICPYDEAFTIQEMLEETGRCLHCFVRQCPLNR